MTTDEAKMMFLRAQEIFPNGHDLVLAMCIAWHFDPLEPKTVECVARLKGGAS